MTYSEEQYKAILAVCRSYKNDYDRAFERLKAQQREIDALKAENERLKDVIKELKQVIHDDVFDQLCPDCAKAGASVLEQIDDIIKEIEK